MCSTLAADGLAWSKSGPGGRRRRLAGRHRRLVQQETLELVEMPPRPIAADLDPDHAKPAAFAAQQARGRSLWSKPLASRFFRRRCSTASPARARRRSISRRSPKRCGAGRQALILLPEIALTGAFLDRFAARFGSRPANGIRRSARSSASASGGRWRDGEARVVVGARSALFLPFPDLGLIVVDEEHDPAYKQEDGVAYHARDMAVVRGSLSGFPVVLSSATPSVETPRQRRPRPLSPPPPAGALRRSRSPGIAVDRPAARPAGARTLAFAAAGQRRRRDDRPRASRRCSS